VFAAGEDGLEWSTVRRPAVGKLLLASPRAGRRPPLHRPDTSTELRMRLTQKSPTHLCAYHSRRPHPVPYHDMT
jgi:hypothetical protein